MNDLLRKLGAELDAFARNAALRAENVPFRRIIDPRGDDIITALTPSDDQRHDARSEQEKFKRWSRTVAAVLRRRGVVTEIDNLARLTDEMTALLGLERQDAADVTEGMWRRGLEKDLAQTSAALRALLTRVSSEFEIVHRRVPLEYVPFEVCVIETAPGRWLVWTKGYTEMIAPADLRIFRTGDDLEAVVDSGQALYRTVFTGAVEASFLEAARKASGEGLGLRVELDLKRAGQLSAAPWESMHDGNQFLSMSPGKSIVRVIEVLKPRVAIPSVTPLRVLLTISSPRSLPWLDGERERQRIEAAVAPLVTLGSMELAIAPDGSMNTLRRMVASADAAGRPFHGWHFIGHGEFDPGKERGTLAMTDEKHEVQRVGGWDLSVVFRNHPQFRFAILNACEGARTSQRGTMFGVATSLIESRIPRVVAMQLPISDRSAIVFAEELYGSLADGASFDEAIAEGRRGILFRPDATEWITPVVFMAAGEPVIPPDVRAEGRILA